jgi:hypothetical protein
MSDRQSAFRRLWVLLGAMMLVTCGVASMAQADPYGEITRFAEKGELVEPEAAFGADVEDDSLYVVDEPDEGKKGFRLQEFEEIKATKKYEVVASAMFNPKGNAESNEIEGVAVDPKRGRVYVLATEERPAKKVDPEKAAAAELYAFQLEQNGSKLEPASGTTGEGLLAGTEVLEPDSNTSGVSLLEPSGITVDPINGDVIISGWEDRAKVANEETPVLQEVETSGKLGSKYVDETGFFEEENIDSPVVSATGQVYVIGSRDEIDEVPTKEGAFLHGAPQHVFRFNCEEEEVEGCASFAKQNPEVLTEFPGEAAEEGAQMSIGAEGDIYVRARIRLSEEAGERHGGVLVLSPSFVEQGWTGGGSQLAGKPTQECSVRELSGRRPLVVAGKERVFMLSRTEYEEGKVSPAIVEFGPNGKACPKAVASPLTVKAGGVEVSHVPIADKATLSSQLTQANALSVEWEFGDGSATQTVSTRAPETSEEIAGGSGHVQVYATASVEHKFLKGGKLTVKERIHTDDLATPLIELEHTVTVVGAPGVQAEVSTVNGTAVTLEGEVDAYGKEITECFFEYGKASEGFPDEVPCSPKPTGEGFVAVSGEVSGLTKLTAYHFRISVKNSSGEATEGAGKSFTTGEPAPAPVTGTATVGGQTTAVLNGHVNPEGETVKCVFQYGASTSYGSEVPCSTALDGQQEAVAESAPLTGLHAGQAYHFRIVALTASGKNYYGADEKFTTEKAPEPTKTSTSNNNNTGTPSPSAEAPPTGTGGVLPEHVAKPPAVPLVTIASASIPVSTAGAFDLQLGCPAEAVSCSGAITVKTLTAVAASSGHEAKKSKKAILTLATGSFAVAGGKPKAIALHLSASARKLLAHSGVLRARVTLVARDPGGATHTTVAIVTLKLTKAHHHG